MKKDKSSMIITCIKGKDRGLFMTKVVICPERFAAEAGMEILKKGGNAVDAVVAGSLAQAVTNPLLCSAGGCGQMNIYMVKNKKPIFASSNAGVGSKAYSNVYEYEERSDTSTAFVGPMVRNREDGIGYKAMITPDLFKVLFDAHKKYGVLEWKDCLTPAIKLAKEGFVVDSFQVKVGFNKRSLQKLYATPEMAKIYLKNGVPYKEGEILVQKDYGDTIEKVAEHGPDIFFKGEIAEKMAEDFEEHGSLVTFEDLKDVKTEWYKPLESTYKEITFYVNIPPSGGPFKLEILNILENFDLKKLGWNTPSYLDVLSRVMNIALADRFLYSIDPNFDSESMSNAKKITSKDYAQKITNMIKSGKDKEYPAPNMAPYHGGTTHIVTYDDEGNCVSMKHSSGSSCGVVTPHIGIPYNNHMEAASLNIGHKRTLEYGFKPKMKLCLGLSPTLGFKEGELFSASGSPGGHNGYMCEIQVLLNVIEFGFRVQAATSSSRIISGNRKNEIIIESSFGYPYPWKNLEKLGHLVTPRERLGLVSMLKIDNSLGDVDFGTDPRGSGGLALE